MNIKMLRIFFFCIFLLLINIIAYTQSRYVKQINAVEFYGIKAASLQGSLFLVQYTDRNYSNARNSGIKEAAKHTFYNNCLYFTILNEETRQESNTYSSTVGGQTMFTSRNKSTTTPSREITTTIITYTYFMEFLVLSENDLNNNWDNIYSVSNYIDVNKLKSSESNRKTGYSIEAPKFYNSYSVVLDMWSYGSEEYEDYVKVTNSTENQQVSFDVYGYNENISQWVLIGSAFINKKNNTCTIQSPLNGKLDNFRWFAIQSLDKINFTTKVNISHNDIKITIFSEDDIYIPVFDKSHSILLDMWSYGFGNYKDYIKIKNSSKKQNVSFEVYGYDQKYSQWVLVGSVNTMNVNDVVTVRSSMNGKLNIFRWYAIRSLNNLTINTQVIISRNDINITIFEEGF